MKQVSLFETSGFVMGMFFGVIVGFHIAVIFFFLPWGVA